MTYSASPEQLLAHSRIKASERRKLSRSLGRELSLEDFARAVIRTLGSIKGPTEEVVEPSYILGQSVKDILDSSPGFSRSDFVMQGVSLDGVKPVVFQTFLLGLSGKTFEEAVTQAFISAERKQQFKIASIAWRMWSLISGRS